MIHLRVVSFVSAVVDHRDVHHPVGSSSRITRRCTGAAIGSFAEGFWLACGPVIATVMRLYTASPHLVYSDVGVREGDMNHRTLVHESSWHMSSS